MDRLTEETQLGPFASLKDKAEAKPGAFHDYDCLYAHMAAVTRLKAYEDTGLEPEEIKQMCALARLNSNIFDNDFGNHIAELIVAEQDGRCVVLPCKVGDTVYMTIRGVVEETKVRTFFVGHPSYNRGEPDPRYEMIRVTNYDIPLRDFGKTVFLTHEEAEAALKDAHKPGGEQE